MRTSAALVAVLVAASLLSACVGHMCGDDDCFKVLGVKRNATKGEIRKAYRKLSREKHPDKRPGDKDLAAEFRAIGRAYEVLTDDEKRAKYEDFLDNPGKYWDILMQNAKDYYAPKSNVILVLTGIVGFFTFINWLNMNHAYNSAQRRIRESPEFKKEVSRLVKSKAAKTKEEAAEMLDVDVVGLEEPNWRNLYIFKAASLPGNAVKYFLWLIRWQINYKIRKQEYSEEDKLYLIQKHLELSDKDWEAVKESDKKTFLEEELWDADTCAEYKRLKRIELNKAGKLKRKKRHTPQPYSEVEDVRMPGE